MAIKKEETHRCRANSQQMRKRNDVQAKKNTMNIVDDNTVKMCETKSNTEIDILPLYRIASSSSSSPSPSHIRPNAMLFALCEIHSGREKSKRY